MRRTILLILTLAVFSNLKASFYELDVSEQVINFSSYCKQGKITVFIMSQDACSPCISAKNFFEQKYANYKNIDIYYCMRTKSKDDLREFQKRPSTIMWSFVEGYTSSPLIYFFGPTGNPRCIYSGFDKEKCTKAMEGLLEAMPYYKKELLVFGGGGDCEEYIANNKNLKSTLDKCSNDKETLEYEKKQLDTNISRLQEDNEVLQKSNELLEEKNIQLQKDNDDLKNGFIRETENSEQLLSNTWYKLAKEYEKQIETQKTNKKMKTFIINQIKIFYEKSMELGKNCNKEYESFKKKYKLVE